MIIDSGKKTILVVEDDNLVRQMLAKQLKSQFDVIEAGSGEKAQQEILANKPDLILLDLLLPGLSGFELLEQIRKNPDPLIAQAKVVILSNLTGDEDIARAKRLSVSSYLTKANIQLEEVSRKVREALKGIESQ